MAAAPAPRKTDASSRPALFLAAAAFLLARQLRVVVVGLEEAGGAAARTLALSDRLWLVRLLHLTAIVLHTTSTTQV